MSTTKAPATIHADEEVLAAKKKAPDDTPPPKIQNVAAEAWEAVKDDEDPSFNDCIRDHREKLITHALSVQKSGVPLEGATEFEKKVAEILAKADKAKSKK